MMAMLLGMDAVVLASMILGIGLLVVEVIHN